MFVMVAQKMQILVNDLNIQNMVLKVEIKDSLQRLFLQNNHQPKAVHVQIGAMYTPGLVRLAEYQYTQGFVGKMISGPAHEDFCQCCAKFVRLDADGWNIEDPGAQLWSVGIAHSWAECVILCRSYVLQ